jgi:hypothetical protein
VSERSLLMGQIESDLQHKPGPLRGTRPTYPGAASAAIGFAIAGVALVVAGAVGVVDRAGAFFGGGSALLGAALCASAALLRRRPAHALAGHGWQPVTALGMRNATYRPGRSVLSIAVIASATFILISVDAFRRGEGAVTTDRQSGGGGYALIVETLLTIAQDPNSREGRETLNLFDLEGVTFEPFRLLPGDDASCLNLYEPRNPRILAPRDSFITEGRFSFQGSLASTDAEAANPWLLLQRTEADGAVPVIADDNSMTYVLHRQLGDDIVIRRGCGWWPPCVTASSRAS